MPHHVVLCSATVFHDTVTSSRAGTDSRHSKCWLAMVSCEQMSRLQLLLLFPLIGDIFFSSPSSLTLFCSSLDEEKNREQKSCFWKHPDIKKNCSTRNQFSVKTQKPQTTPTKKQTPDQTKTPQKNTQNQINRVEGTMKLSWCPKVEHMLSWLFMPYLWRWPRRRCLLSNSLLQCITGQHTGLLSTSIWFSLLWTPLLPLLMVPGLRPVLQNKALHQNLN